MKVCLTLDSSLMIPGGVQSLVRGLADALSRRGHRVTILTAGGVSQEDQERQVVTLGKSKEISLLASASLPLILVNPLKIYRFFKSERFDVVHVPGHGGLLSWWAVLVSPAPVVATFHPFNESKWHRVWLRFLRPFFWVLNRRLKVRMADSGAAADYARLLFPGEYQIVYPGVDLKRFFPQEGRLRRKKVKILFVGRLDPRKGILDLLQAVKKLKQEDGETKPREQQFCLEVVGDGPRRQQAKEFVKQHALDDVVEFVGRVSDEELTRRYREADIYCSPAKQEESFGVVLLEAMASGLPIVAYGNQGYREVLTGRLAEFLVRPGDIEGLAGKLKQLIEDERVRKEMRKLSLERAKAFDWDKVALKIERIY